MVFNQNITEYLPVREAYTLYGWWYSNYMFTATCVFETMMAEDIVLCAN